MPRQIDLKQNLFKIDHSPLDMISEDPTGIIGGHIDQLSSVLLALPQEALTLAQDIIDSILAWLGFPAGSGVTSDIDALFQDLGGFLANVNFGSSGFDLPTAIANFITSNLKPSNLIAMLVTDATQSGGVTGFIPMENLAVDLILGGVESVQSLVDAILGWLGFAPGSGTVTNVDQMFTDIGKFLSNTTFGLAGFDLPTAIQNFLSSWPSSALLNPFNIPGLDATKIISGAFGIGQIPFLPASQITSGTFVTSLIPLLDPHWIVGNTTYPSFLATLIPGLDATKIISGVFPQSMLNLTNIPASIVSGVLGASQIPGLDATKIISGIFPQSMVNLTNIPASIVSGVLGAGQIPGLDASKIISGVFTVPQIPPLDTSQIQSGVFGQWLLPNIPVGSVGQITPNLLANPNYATATSVQSNPDWSWDSTVDHTGDGSGSVKCLCTGAEHDLLSDPPTPVAPNQTLSLTHYLTWTGATGTGPCFQLSVIAYNGGTLVNSTVLQTISNPAASSGWTQIGGSYTVPASGVNNVRLELQVLAGATAGTTHWDDGSITKTQLLAESWTAGLPGDLSNLNTAVIARALQTDVMSLVNNLGLGSFSSVGGGLSAITSRLAGLPASGTILSSFIPGLDATKIISGAFSIGQIPTSQLGLSNIADLQSLNTHVTNALIGAGSQFATSTLPQARGSMDSIYSNVINNGQAILAMQSQQQATNVSGVGINIDFANYPNGAMPSFFTVTYSGAGTSAIGINGGVAGWNPLNNDGNRTAYIIYNAAPTNTDFQRVSGSMQAAPSGATSGGTPHFYALGRVDSPSNPKNYVWGRAYCTGFLTYKADLGYTLAGVDTVWASGIGLTWSTSMMVVFGSNGNPRQYQVFSGTQLVYQGIEVGTNSLIGAGYRYWGARNECTTTSSGSPGSGGSVAGVAVSDNAPPNVVGSTFRAARFSTTNVSFPSGAAQPIPANFYDTLTYISPDWTWNPSTNVLTLSAANGLAGTYVVKMATQINNIPTGQKFSLWLNHNGNWADVVASAFADGFNGNSPAQCMGVCNVYLNPGDTLVFYYWDSGTCTMTGETSGMGSVVSVALANRSLA